MFKIPLVVPVALQIKIGHRGTAKLLFSSPNVLDYCSWNKNPSEEKQSNWVSTAEVKPWLLTTLTSKQACQLINPPVIQLITCSMGNLDFRWEADHATHTESSRILLFFQTSISWWKPGNATIGAVVSLLSLQAPCKSTNWFTFVYLHLKH